MSGLQTKCRSNALGGCFELQIGQPELTCHVKYFDPNSMQKDSIRVEALGHDFTHFCGAVQVEAYIGFIKGSIMEWEPEGLNMTILHPEV